MQKIITVKSSEVAQGAKGDYLKVTSEDDKTTNIFKPIDFELFKAGESVELTLEKKDKWWNVTHAEVAKVVEEKPPEKKPEISEPSHKPEDKRVDSIEAQVVWKGVVELLVGKIITLEYPLVKRAIAWAETKLPKIPEIKTIHPQLVKPPLEATESTTKPVDTSPPSKVMWADIQPKLSKVINAKTKGWTSTDDLLKQVEKLGADIKSGNIKTSFETLSPDMKQEFYNLVDKAL